MAELAAHGTLRQPTSGSLASHGGTNSYAESPGVVSLLCSVVDGRLLRGILVPWFRDGVFFALGIACLGRGDWVCCPVWNGTPVSGQKRVSGHHDFGANVWGDACGGGKPDSGDVLACWSGRGRRNSWL